jgi:2-keto-4-pentenoate hydratase
VNVTNKIDRLAAALADAWTSNTPIPLPAADDAPASRQEAFAIQDRMAHIIGQPVAGWKVGAAVRAVQVFEGHDGPIPGRVFAPRVFLSPATPPAGAFDGYKVECEFAFRADKAFPPRPQPYTRADIAPHLTLHFGIELAGSRYQPNTGGRKFTTHDAIADNGAGGGFVFGAGIKDWQKLDFETLPITATIDGGAPIQTYTGEMRRDPVDIFVETVNDLVARGITLDAGHYISTGSLTLPTQVYRGQQLIARFGDFEPLQMRLA